MSYYFCCFVVLLLMYCTLVFALHLMALFDKALSLLDNISTPIYHTRFDPKHGTIQFCIRIKDYVSCKTLIQQSTLGISSCHIVLSLFYI
jgi:hypothetical protein